MAKSLDRTGMWVTTLCALHCLLLPVILPLLAMAGLSFLGEDLLERIILSISIIIGMIALGVGIRQHNKFYPLGLLMLGGVVYWHKDSLGDAGEPVIILLGAALIIASHWINLRLTRGGSCRLASVAPE